MPLTGLFLLPTGPTTPSPTPSLLTYLTLQLSAQPLTSSPSPFTLTHHLFASTSSLLPGAAATRQHTSVLTVSHTPALTYVGTTSSNAPTSHIIIPTASAESFLQILHAKMQPLWAPRQTMLVLDGTALSVDFPMGTFEVRVGDMRLSQRQGTQINPLRGVLVEITSPTMDGPVGEKATDQEGQFLRELFETVLAKCHMDIKMEDVKMLARYTEDVLVADGAEKDLGDSGEKNKKKKQTQWALAEIYMEMLRTRA